MSKMSRTDGGPAFPCVKTRRTYVTDPDVHSIGGMTLLDYFAAKAMQGMLAEIGPDEILDEDVVSETAYGIAAKMIAERQRRMGGQ
jgi:hypothetical protein